MTTALLFLGALAAGDSAHCDRMADGSTPAPHSVTTSEKLDATRLPAGVIECKRDPGGGVTRTLFGEVGGTEFLLDLSTGSGGVPGAAVPGESEDVSPHWYVKCEHDQVAARRICLVQKGALTVFRVNGDPVIRVGKNYWPASEIILRVDEYQPFIANPITVADWDHITISEQLLAGDIVRYRFRDRYEGSTSASIGLQGFSQAYRLLEAAEQALP